MVVCIFVALYLGFVKRYEMIEDTLLFILSIKLSLSNNLVIEIKYFLIYLIFILIFYILYSEKYKYSIFSDFDERVFQITLEPNIPQRPFCIRNQRQDILYPYISKPSTDKKRDCQNPSHNLNTTQDNLNCSWV